MDILVFLRRCFSAGVGREEFNEYKAAKDKEFAAKNKEFAAKIDTYKAAKDKEIKQITDEAQALACRILEVRLCL